VLAPLTVKVVALPLQTDAAGVNVKLGVCVTISGITLEEVHPLDAVPITV
jgi:hypothetical protein